MRKQTFSLIAAVSENGVIGKNGRIPWHISADLKQFKEKTTGHAIIMGRATFISLGRPLPNRTNIVITRDATFQAPGCIVCNSLQEALEKAKAIEPEEIFIIGGEEIFKQSMNIADRLYITHIDAVDKYADTFFPEIIPIVWNEISHEEHKKDKDNPHDYTFSVYERF